MMGRWRWEYLFNRIVGGVVVGVVMFLIYHYAG